MGMGFDRQEHIQVTCGPPTQASIAFAGNTQARAGIDSSRDIDAQLFTHLSHALPSTGIAGISNHLTTAIAGRTFGHLGEVAEGVRVARRT